MFTEVCCLIGFIVLTIVVYFLSVAGTKEVTFEEALAKQRAKIREENPNSTQVPKPKAAVKGKSGGRKRFDRKKEDPPTSTTQASSSSSSADDHDRQLELIEQHRLEQETIRDQERLVKKEKERAKREKEAANKAEQEMKRKEQEAKKKEQEALKKQEERLAKEKRMVELQAENVEKEEVACVEKHQLTEQPKPIRQRKNRKGLTNGTTDTDTDTDSRQNGEEKKAKAVPEIDAMLLDAIESQQKHVAKHTQSAAADPKAAVKKPTKHERGSVKSVLDSVERAQLTSDQLQSVVNSLLAIASEGGWSETRKTADSVQIRELEKANAKLKELEESKNGLTTKINSLRAELNTEKSKATQLKLQVEEGVAELAKAIAKERAAGDLRVASAQLQTAQAVTEARNALLREYETDKMRQMESSARVTEESQQQLQQSQQQHQLALHQIQQTQLEERDQLQTSVAATADLTAEAEKQVHEARAAHDEQCAARVQISHELAQAREQLGQAQAKHESCSSELSQMDSQYKALLARLHSGVCVDPSLEYSAFMQQFETAVETHKSGTSSPVNVEIVEKLVTDPAQAEQIHQLQESNARLVEQVSCLESSLTSEKSLVKEVSLQAQEASRQAEEATKHAEDAKKQAEDAKSRVEEATKKADDAKRQAEEAAKRHEEQSKNAPDFSALEEELRSQNKQLSDQVLHYKSVLDNTETLLRSLETSVEKREEELRLEAVQKGLQLETKEDAMRDLNKQLNDVKEKAQELEEIKAENVRLQHQLEEMKKDQETAQVADSSDQKPSTD